MTDPDGQPRATANWLYSAPEATGTSEPTLTTRLGEGTQSLDVTRGFAAAQAPAEQAIAMARDPFARPVLLGLEQNADAVMPGWAHQQALRRLLLPEGAGDGAAPLQGWEEALARGHLKAVLHNAQSVDAAAFAALDDRLSQLLCDSWPRSAPLLEPAAQVFSWGDGDGGRGLTVRQHDVARLLAMVRAEVPGPEQRLDPARLALWIALGLAVGILVILGLVR